MGCIFIEELFYGNIAPQELADDNRKKLLTSAWKKQTNLEESLLKRLIGEDLKLFEEYTENYRHVYSWNEAAAFVKGFRIGSKLTLDTFSNPEDLLF